MCHWVLKILIPYDRCEVFIFEQIGVRNFTKLHQPIYHCKATIELTENDVQLFFTSEIYQLNSF